MLLCVVACALLWSQTLQTSLSQLGLSYVDLYLIHAPFKPEIDLQQVRQGFTSGSRDGAGCVWVCVSMCVCVCMIAFV